MKLFSTIKQLIYKTDFFYTKQLLRHKHETQYRTLFGGISSIIIILTLVVVFYQKVIDTFDEVLISSASNNINMDDPLPSTISTYPQGKFMLAVQVYNHNLNGQERYFNVELINYENLVDQRIVWNVSRFDLQPCRPEHWQGFPSIQEKYQALNMKNWRCLPKNHQLEISGKYSTLNYKFARVRLTQCTNDTDQDTPCVSQDQIDDYIDQRGVFEFTVYFINPLINPTNKDYLRYYLEDRNFISFTKNFGGQAYLYVQDFTITTDQSILPYTKEKVDTGQIISELSSKDMYERTQAFPTYAGVVIMKSGMAKYYERKFYKLDELFSYIGGLFQTIAMLLFLVNIYNNYSLQVTLGGQIFNHKKCSQEQEGIFKKYHFFHFILHGIYNFFDMLGCKLDWKVTQKLDAYRQEMIRHLDIEHLIDRIIFLEKSLSLFFEEHQIKGLHLHERIDLDQARKRRKYFKIKKKVRKIRKKIELKRQQDMTKNIFNHAFSIFPSKVSNSFQLQNQINQNSIENLNQTVNKQIQTLPKFRQQDESQQRINQRYYDSSDESHSSDSENESDEDRRLVQEIKTLQRQALEGNVLSRKIWSKIDQSIKMKVKYIARHIKSETSNQRSPQKSMNQFQPETWLKDYVSQLSNSKFNDLNQKQQNRQNSLKRSESKNYGLRKSKNLEKQLRK